MNYRQCSEVVVVAIVSFQMLIHIVARTLTRLHFNFRFPADGSEPIPKPKDIPRIEAYECAVEPSDAHELDELLADPDAMRMQALVIRERILGTFFLYGFRRPRCLPGKLKTN